MSKRRSNDGDMVEMFLPPKRLAIGPCATSYGSGSIYVTGSQAAQPDTGLGQASTSALAQVDDSTLEVWLAVAAQVQDALAALPGWIQVAQAAQVAQHDQPEQLLSSLSSASTPSLPVQHRGSIEFGSWPTQPSAAKLRTSDFADTSLQQAGASPGAPAAAGTPAAPAATAPSSCASDSDASAAACGWFSKCRGCCQMTAGEAELQGQVVPLCRGCSSSLHRRPPAEREHGVHRIMRAHAALCQREAAAGAGAAAGSS
ncbi:hypothetical protein PLESTB_000481800 [Pleodorina starrii]|uniref:Uncharacterized protein n=1 Tax=Pleodorina starrii TaxID=330485 RepID=A0A9W6BG90_9CHLO|nr:hypothetical protein PLESTM_001584600 [Pleodorina starrii]GLC51245.1 hypothetical protein PLESTB_000481800 [Pleodorina starrii]